MNKKVWFSIPAKHWRQALPIGNGYSGAMLFGGIRKERIALNDGTLWSGFPKDQTNSDSLKYLPKVRELVFRGKNSDADKLCMEKLCGAYCESFMPLGEITLSFRGVSKQNYCRELELNTAIHRVTTGEMQREAFASFPDKVIAYKIESQNPFSVVLKAKSQIKSETIIDTALNLMGNAPDYVAPNYLRTKLCPIKYNEGKGMSFCARAEFITDGEVKYKRNSVMVKKATKLTIYIATATGFRGFNQTPETDRIVPQNACKQILKCIEGVNYSELKKRHTEDFSSLYNKQDISLKSETTLATDALIKKAKGGDVETALIDLFYHFGKYLIVSGSRKGGQALNLQGIWNKDIRPAWSSNYTTNINAQMNYWSATRSGLSDCLEPYLNLIYEIMQTGKKTAEMNYGCGGFACNHNVDIWRKSTPVRGNPAYMYAPLCGAWLANELYFHFKNGALEEESKKVYEIVKEAAKFCNDYLVLHNGYYVTAPSASPEANFKRGNSASLDYASAFEMGIVKQCFCNYLDFGTDDDLSVSICEKKPKLYPYQKGSTGLLEWHDDVPITEKGHRHFSPLYGFYPANVIRYYRDSEQVKWVEELFNYRINNSSQFIGWSAAWAICLAGRMHNGEKALHIMNSMMGHSVFYNLFAVHPPFIFQIDGNLGFVAGINEMLVYEEDGIIDLLPALPNTWKNGFVKNMVVHGAEISFEWKDGVIFSVTANKPVTVRLCRPSLDLHCAEHITLI
ncbi:MAG: glycoside hydrolase family 95 protein [Oscillospiraceae bacterium]